MTLIFAHRGASGDCPENTMIAFKEAHRAGADGIELDVQLTADGEIVVIHDETIDRTTNGKGFVQDFTTEQIQSFDASYIFKKWLKKPRIPTLIEVFDWLSRNELLCNIELKNSTLPYPGLEEKVISLIRKYQFEYRVIISSFNHYSLVYCHRLAPDIETAPLYSSSLYMPWVYAQSIHAKAIHPKLKVASNEIIQEAMESGIEVRPYTVNKDRDMERLFTVGCSAFITNFPDKACRIRDRLS
jgi:glycerophosphoryl diester phosphodiesterase